MNKGNTLIQVRYSTHAKLKEAYLAQKEYPSLWTFTDRLILDALSHSVGQLELSLAPSQPSTFQILMEHLRLSNAPDKLRVIWRFIRPVKDVGLL
jgi:hypothetical protein